MAERKTEDQASAVEKPTLAQVPREQLVSDKDAQGGPQEPQPLGKEATGEHLSLAKEAKGEQLPLDKEVQGEHTTVDKDAQGEYPSLDKEVQGEFPSLDREVHGEYASMDKEVEHPSLGKDVQGEHFFLSKEPRSNRAFLLKDDCETLTSGFTHHDYTQEYFSLPKETQETPSLDKEGKKSRGFEREERERLLWKKKAYEQQLLDKEQPALLKDALEQQTTNSENADQREIVTKTEAQEQLALRKDTLAKTEISTLEKESKEQLVSGRHDQEQTPFQNEAEDEQKIRFETFGREQDDSQKHLQGTQDESTVFNDQAREHLNSEIFALVQRARNQFVVEEAEKQKKDTEVEERIPVTKDARKEEPSEKEMVTPLSAGTVNQEIFTVKERGEQQPSFKEKQEKEVLAGARETNKDNTRQQLPMPIEKMTVKHIPQESMASETDIRGPASRHKVSQDQPILENEPKELSAVNPLYHQTITLGGGGRLQMTSKKQFQKKMFQENESHQEVEPGDKSRAQQIPEKLAEEGPVLDVDARKLNLQKETCELPALDKQILEQPVLEKEAQNAQAEGNETVVCHEEQLTMKEDLHLEEQAATEQLTLDRSAPEQILLQGHARTQEPSKEAITSERNEENRPVLEQGTTEYRTVRKAPKTQPSVVELFQDKLTLDKETIEISPSSSSALVRGIQEPLDSATEHEKELSSDNLARTESSPEKRTEKRVAVEGDVEGGNTVVENVQEKAQLTLDKDFREQELATEDTSQQLTVANETPDTTLEDLSVASEAKAQKPPTHKKEFWERLACEKDHASLVDKEEVHDQLAREREDNTEITLDGMENQTLEKEKRPLDQLIDEKDDHLKQQSLASETEDQERVDSTLQKKNVQHELARGIEDQQNRTSGKDCTQRLLTLQNAAKEKISQVKKGGEELTCGDDEIGYQAVFFQRDASDQPACQEETTKKQVAADEKEAQVQVAFERGDQTEVTLEKVTCEQLTGEIGAKTHQLLTTDKQAQEQDRPERMANTQAPPKDAQEMMIGNEAHQLPSLQKISQLTIDKEIQGQTDYEKEPKEQVVSEGDDIKRQLLELAEKVQQQKSEETEAPTHVQQARERVTLEKESQEREQKPVETPSVQKESLVMRDADLPEKLSREKKAHGDLTSETEKVKEQRESLEQVSLEQEKPEGPVRQIVMKDEAEVPATSQTESHDVQGPEKESDRLLTAKLEARERPASEKGHFLPAKGTQGNLQVFDKKEFDKRLLIAMDEVRATTSSFKATMEQWNLKAAAHEESTSDESSLDEFRLGNYVSLDEQERRREAFEKEFHKRPRSDMEASERLVLETVPEEPVSEDEGAAKPFLGEKARKQFSFYQEPIESDENLEEKLGPDDDSEGKRARREELFDTDTDSFEEDARSIETDPMGVPIPKSRKKRNRSTAKTSLSDIVADIVPYFEQKMKTRVEGEDSKRKDELWSSSSCVSRSSGSRTYLERLTEKRSRPAVQQAAIDSIKQEYMKSRQLEELNLKLRGKSAHPTPKPDKKKDKRRNSCVFC